MQQSLVERFSARVRGSGAPTVVLGNGFVMTKVPVPHISDPALVAADMLAFLERHHHA